MEATGLVGSPRDRARVVGVTARSRDGGATTEILADLVVDASGRASKAPAWLSALGLRAPEESVVDSFAGYSSRWYRRPDASRWPARFWWKGLWIDPAPPERLTGGVLFPVEGDRWIATLIGFSRCYPPTEEEGFDRAIRDLPSPAIAETLALGEPISPVYATRSMSNRFRHYERMPDRIDGFTAVGDSVCVYNPIYGQGMTVSALCARALEDTIARVGPSAPGLGRAFFQAQARVFEAPWSLAAGNDLRFPATVGERAPLAAFLKVYTDALSVACLDDEEIHRRAMEVYYMLKPGHHLFAPDIVGRVVASAVRRRLRQIAGEPAIAAMPPG
jgi:flavin-dependent dehydrogenase